MILYPYAKINIGLEVVCRRPDGYHDLQTLFYPLSKVGVSSFESHLQVQGLQAGCYDILEVVPSKELKMNLYGLTYPGEPLDNICIKAWQLIKQDYPDLQPVEISLFKRVPVGAGLGGGSSDCAHTIKAIDQIFSLGMSLEQKLSYAAALGSDCPFFIYDKPMFGTGRGEILEDYDLDLDAMGFELKLVHPPFFISTKDAYGGIVPRERWPKIEQNGKDIIPLKELLAGKVESWKAGVVNDFEATVFEKYPELASYKKKLYDQGAVYASMSGSGSTMFGIFKK